ncbi:hypothetical protein F4604DRAFT_1206261 [Suillus subluteus]|nr:hypothetical protein F4604DRAFT_1206261 [Suillus subluteus]
MSVFLSKHPSTAPRVLDAIAHLTTSFMIYNHILFFTMLYTTHNIINLYICNCRIFLLLVTVIARLPF